MAHKGLELLQKRWIFDLGKHEKSFLQEIFSQHLPYGFERIKILRREPERILGRCDLRLLERIFVA
jgi:hypothetical protein